MIIVTRLNGAAFALNPDLIERIEETPDTVITLVDGTKYVVREHLDEIIARVRDAKASVIAMSHLMESHLADQSSATGPALRLVPDHPVES